MTNITLDQWMAKTILRRFNDLRDSIRQDFAKGRHVIEFSKSILRTNAPNLYKQGVDINQLFSIFIKVKSDAKKYTGQFITDKDKTTYYLKDRSKFLIIAPSYGVVRSILTAMGKEAELEATDFKNLQIGHTSAFGLEEKNTVQGARIKTALKASRVSKTTIKAIFDIFDKKLSELHAPYVVKFSKQTSLTDQLVGKVNFIYTVPQDPEINRYLSTFEKKIGQEFLKYVKSLIDVRTSPTITEMLLEDLEDAFLGNKVSPRKYTKIKRGRLDLVNGNKVVINKVSFTSTEDKESTLNTIRLQTLLNLRLHDQIKLNMGKGRSKNVLNYRTGRFAKSAKVKAVTSGTRADYMDVYYTYQRYPYDTFLPGGRLYKPGRDPRLIIGRSIRQLATQFMSNNFKVNPVLEGGL